MKPEHSPSMPLRSSWRRPASERLLAAALGASLTLMLLASAFVPYPLHAREAAPAGETRSEPFEQVRLDVQAVAERSARDLVARCRESMLKSLGRPATPRQLALIEGNCGRL